MFLIDDGSLLVPLFMVLYFGVPALFFFFVVRFLLKFLGGVHQVASVGESGDENGDSFWKSGLIAIFTFFPAIYLIEFVRHRILVGWQEQTDQSLRHLRPEIYWPYGVFMAVYIFVAFVLIRKNLGLSVGLLLAGLWSCWQFFTNLPVPIPDPLVILIEIILIIMFGWAVRRVRKALVVIAPVTSVSPPTQ